MMTIGTRPCSGLSRANRISSRLLMSGMLMSVMIRSKWVRGSIFSASKPLAVGVTWKPLASSAATAKARIDAESSTSKTRKADSGIRRIISRATASQRVGHVLLRGLRLDQPHLARVAGRGLVEPQLERPAGHDAAGRPPGQRQGEAGGA